MIGRSKVIWGAGLDVGGFVEIAWQIVDKIVTQTSFNRNEGEREARKAPLGCSGERKKAGEMDLFGALHVREGDGAPQRGRHGSRKHERGNSVITLVSIMQFTFGSHY